MRKNYTTDKRKKLAAYSAMAGALLVCSDGAFAQSNVIIYTDVDPDETHDMLNPEFLLDVNDDGVTDFSLYVFTIEGTYSSGSTGTFFVDKKAIYAIPSAFNNSIAAYSTSNGYVFPYALNNADNIDTALAWNNRVFQSLVFDAYYNITAYSATYNLESGAWLNGQTDKYLGLRFELDGNQYYGWLRLDVSENNTSYTVKDYAYNTIAEQSIEAGQDFLAGVHNSIDPALINIFSFTNEIHIRTENTDAANLTVTIYNAAGKLVYRDFITDKETKITLTDAHGLYTVRVTADGGVFSKTVSVFE